MSKKVNEKLEKIRARGKASCGMFPGMNRSRKFRDRKHHANKYGSRGKVEVE